MCLLEKHCGAGTGVRAGDLPGSRLCIQGRAGDGWSSSAEGGLDQCMNIECILKEVPNRFSFQL